MHKSVYYITLAISLLWFTNNVLGQGQIIAESKQVTLPNGWKLTPAGKQYPLGDLPLNITISNSKKYLAVTNNGQSEQSIQLFSAKDLKQLDLVPVKVSWLGLVFSADDKYLYASGGNGNYILRYALLKNKLVASDTFFLDKPWPVKVSVAGIAIDDKRNLLYAVTKENNSLYVIDTETKKVKHIHELGAEGYTCLLSPDGKVLYITCWGCDKVFFYDTQSNCFFASVNAGDNPNDMCLTRKGDILYVANGNDNSVSVISVEKRKVIETLNAALYPSSPQGSTSNSVALSADNKTLYVANADNNCLAVFNTEKPGESKSKGFIPTGWYPTCVRVLDNMIFVANGKGLTSLANPNGPNPLNPEEEVVYQQKGNAKEKVQYIGGLFLGSLSAIPNPTNEQLAKYSQMVYQNTPYSKEGELSAEGEKGNPIPMQVGDSSPIKYVFYIVKENRTYDQVLGDLPQGNGDTSLVLFGKHITPNQHALASEFVLLDNFYVNGEVSADGHNWSLGAYATDYLEKNWPTSYGGRGGTYDAEGTREIANNKFFIWDICKRFGVSYRTYGEFADDYKPNLPVLINHYCTYYTSWDESVRDTIRFRQWKRDFDSLLTINQVPQLNTLRFINDHTEGLNLGKPTPFAHVADNDLATGMFVDYLSHSSIWNQSVVFILEDDAQNGPDHVDAHRSPAYIAGGFVKQGFVDHTCYSTTSVLRTIELILGLPPMSQYDAAATPLWRCFSNKASHPVFIYKPCEYNLDEKNTVISKWSKMSEKMDFSKEDRAPDDLFNEIIWKSVKGLDSPCPPPVHSAFLFSKNEDEDD